MRKIEQKKAWKAFESALQREMRMGTKAYERKRTVQMYEKLLDRHRRSVAAKHAKARLQRLQD